MRGEGIAGCLEKAGAWTLGAVFAAAGVWAIAGVASADQPLVVAYLALLLLHTSAMVIFGFAFERGKKLWAISWLVLMVGFFLVAAIVGSR